MGCAYPSFHPCCHLEGHGGTGINKSKYYFRISTYIKAHPGATLAEIAAACHLDCTIATLDNTLRRMGLTYKKTLRASEQDREDVAAGRRDWKERSREWTPSQLVFIDEAGVTTKMTRLYGRALRGERPHDTAPHGHWGVRTLIGSIRGDGQTTCMTIDAPTDKDVFLAYVRKVLVPSLRRGGTLSCWTTCALTSHRKWLRPSGLREPGCSFCLPPCWT